MGPVSAVLALERVAKRYRRRGPWVLSGADLLLQAGSVTSVVGANGSGKSTLLRIAAGVTAPSQGRVCVPRQVGYAPERLPGRLAFSATQYLAHMGRIRGLHARDVAVDGTALMARLGLRPGPDVPWNDLSKGNRQKVVLAQAFLGHAELVVLDEPASGLDREARVVLRELISDARDRGTAVLTSSHQTAAGSSRTLRLADGVLEEVGDPPPPPPTGGPLRRVELFRPDPDAAIDELTRRAALVTRRVTRRGTTLVLDVGADACDALLRTALEDGWSVHSLTHHDRGA